MSICRRRNRCGRLRPESRRTLQPDRHAGDSAISPWCRPEPRCADFISAGGRKGYCEQYAAAMARQLRAAGIPARVAFGWTLGNRRKGNTYTLTNKPARVDRGLLRRLRPGAVRPDAGRGHGRIGL
jgi:hypothetical protein